MSICEQHASFRQAIQMRSLRVGMASQTTDPIIQIVHRNEQDVRAFVSSEQLCDPHRVERNCKCEPKEPFVRSKLFAMHQLYLKLGFRDEGSSDVILLRADRSGRKRRDSLPHPQHFLIILICDWCDRRGNESSVIAFITAERDGYRQRSSRRSVMGTENIVLLAESFRDVALRQRVFQWTIGGK